MNPDNIIVKLPEPSVFSEWVAVSQIVANVAVIVAIVVAVMQWRSTHSSASSTAEQFHTQAMKDFWMTLAADADLAYLYRVGRQTPEKLNEKKKFVSSMQVLHGSHFKNLCSHKLPKVEFPKNFIRSGKARLQMT